MLLQRVGLPEDGMFPDVVAAMLWCHLAHVVCVDLQAQLDSMHQRATATQTSLLEQIALLQQQLDKERADR